MINNIINIAEYKHETVSGQGSVSWDDGIKCYIPSVKVKGKAEQEIYSGINLWDNLILQPLQYNAYVSLKSVEKSSFIITTTEGYTGNGGCNTQKTLQQICPALQIGKTYTLWAKTDSASQKLFYLNASGVSWRFGAQRTITQTDLSSLINVYGLNASKNEGVGDCVISEIMLTEYSTQPTYEPYVGGIPAPNPLYPIYPSFTVPQLNALSAIMITESAVQPEYTPYFDGGTVQCPELYSMPDGEFTDIYDTQSGILLHSMGKVALTGRESIVATTAYGNGVKISGALNGYVAGGGHIGLCSHAIVGNDKDMHFGSISKAVLWHNVLDDLGMTLDDFKAWLTNQYELGSPVTIWYPLLNPTETIVSMPEKLKMPKGSGQIIQTDSGLVAGIEVKVLKHS